jgi:parallel beta-helix repeat protein
MNRQKDLGNSLQCLTTKAVWLLIIFLCVTQALAASITGTVFEDFNYGGGTGRAFVVASGMAARPNVRVELYGPTGTFLQAAFTNASGQYTFTVATGTTGTGNYTVRVVNSFVTSRRTGACALAVNVTTPPAACTQLPVQTFRVNGGTADGNRVGGEAPNKTDAAANTTSATLASLTPAGGTTAAQSVASVNLPNNTTNRTGVDFGFNFATIVSSRDAGQGSLRQFIINSNALANTGLDQDETANTVASAVSKAAGDEVSIFMIPTSDPNYSAGAVTIRPVTELENITAANTAINGKTQTAYTGDLRTIVAPAFDAAGAVTNSASVTRGPEIIIQGSTTFIGEGLTIAATATNAKVEGIRIQNFVNGAGFAHGLFLIGDSALVRDVDISNNQGSGIEISTGTTTLVANGQILNSVFYGNGVLANSGSDGVSLQGTSGFTVDNNFFAANGCFGIDLTPRADNTNAIITNNIVTGNGSTAGTTSQNGGISLRRASNALVSTNRIFGNTGDGIIVKGSQPATGNRLTQNSIYNNGELGIDLNAGTVSNGDGASLNSNTDTGGNDLLNFPVLESVRIEANRLIIEGFSKPSTTIEFFIADADPSSFGEGRTYLATLLEGSAQDTDTATGSYGPAAVNGVVQGSDTTNRFRFSFALPAGVTTSSFITATATCLSASGCTVATTNSTSEFSARVQASTVQLSGRIFEDFNYGGGAGRAYNAAQGMSLRPGVRVELYNNAGTYLIAALTDNAGAYSFNVLPNTGYTVRVVNGFVTSSRTGGCTPSTDVATPPASCTQLPVQTFRTSGLTSNVGTADTSRVGGEDPTKVDAALNSSGTLASLTTPTTAAQSITSVTTATANISNIDFGFNFDTIVSTRDAGQGSLRQFILNSNALGGEASLAQSGSRQNAGSAQALPAGKETSIFMISNGVANPGLRAGLTNQLTGGVAVITPATVLKALTGANAPNTNIDGTTQSFNVRVSSGGAETNPGVLGSGGTVGVDALTLSQVQRPEVQIVGTTTNLVGFDLQASNLTVRGVSIYGFGNAPNNDASANIRIGNTYINTLIEQNILGTPATSFSGSSAASGTNPCGGARSSGDNIRSLGGDDGIVRNNLVGWSAGKGFGVELGSQRWLIENNEMRCNAIGNPNLDAIDLESGTTAFNTVRGNLLWQNEGVGADGYQSGGNNAIINNTITQNGIGGPSETAGVRLYGPNNMIIKNLIFSNYGAGIMATCQTNCAATNTFSLNSIYDNGEIVNKTGGAASGQIGIDLLDAAQGEDGGVSPYVTKNDSGDTDTGANGLLNFPVFEGAEINGGNLVLKGFSRPGAVIEVFISNDDPSGFGEGQTYRISLREGGTAAGTLVNGVNVDPVADADNTTGTYNVTSATGPGTDTTNRFEFTIALPSGVSAGTRLTATATLLSGSTVSIGGTSYQTGTTSEFSSVVAVTTNIKLGLAKSLDRIIHSNNATDNVYTLVYRLTAENFSVVTLNSLELFDDVVTQFSGLSPSNYNTWVNVPANAALLTPAGTLTRSATWNGTATSNILTTGQSLAANATGIIYISFDVTVNPAATAPNNRLRDNRASVRGTSPSSIIVTDTSTNGTDPDGTNNDNNPNESVLTPAPFVKLVKEVRNCGSTLTACPGTYGTSATGKPGDYLEYRVRYINISSQNITALIVKDTLVSTTPFQEDTYAVVSPNIADFNVTCPNASLVDLDRTNAAVVTVPPAGAITAFDLNVSTACALATVTPAQQGQVLFKVRIP